jgi:MtN3 and saliva related transmembrane protein
MDWLFYGLGILAATLTSGSWIPQIIKGFKTRQLGDISTMMLGIFGLGTGCWLTYGIWLKDWIIIGANAWTCSNILMLLVMKVMFRNKKPEPEPSAVPPVAVP